MTRKLYYEDCHLREFTARVVSCEEDQKGWEVVLDRTAFYPEGGGQACDIGSLGGVKVLDTRELMQNYQQVLEHQGVQLHWNL